jgi:hypothetical protein
VTEDEAFLELSQLTSASDPSLTAARWREIMSLPDPLRDATLANMRDQDWSDPATTTGQRIVAVFLALGTIAGVVSGVASAGSAVKALTGH